MFHRCKTLDETKKLYRRLVKFLHPDAGGDGELMTILQECYEYHIAKISVEPVTEKKPPKKKYPGEYQETQGPVKFDSADCHVFDEVFVYARHHKKFDPSFADSLFERLVEKGEISAKSYNALLKVYYAFKMHEWIKTYVEDEEDSDKPFSAFMPEDS